MKSGVSKHGKGNWKDILNDSEFAVLRHRTNVNLKDKWRNIQKELVDLNGRHYNQQECL